MADNELRDRVAEGLSDLLTMLGVDPHGSSGDSLDSRTTAQVLADAALAGIGKPVGQGELASHLSWCYSHDYNSDELAVNLADEFDIRHRPITAAELISTDEPSTEDRAWLSGVAERHGMQQGGDQDG